MTRSTEETDLIEERLQRLHGTPRREKKTVKPWAVGLGGAVVGLLAGGYLVIAAPDLRRATDPVETSSAGALGVGASGLDGFQIRTEDEAAPIATEPSAEVAKLQALVDELTGKIRDMERNPITVAVADDAALKGLRDQMEAIKGELASRDKALEANETARSDLQRQLLTLQGELDTERLAAQSRAEKESQEVEAERQRQEQEALLQGQINSDMVAWRSGGGGTAGETTGAAQDRHLGDDDFLRATAKPAEVRTAELIANPSNTIIQGTVIEAALETAINSDLPGTVSAVVSTDVWSFDMQKVLIPRGSKLFGRYASDVGTGQKRILIAWNRIVTTDGQSVNIASYGSDGLGRSGLPANVRSHFLQRFGSAALLSVIGALPDYATDGREDNSTSLIKTVGGDMEEATDSAIGDYLSIPPTLSTDQGAVVMIRVDSDIQFYR